MSDHIQQWLSDVEDFICCVQEHIRRALLLDGVLYFAQALVCLCYLVLFLSLVHVFREASAPAQCVEGATTGTGAR